MCEHYWVSKIDLDKQMPNLCKGESGPVDAVLTFRPVNPTSEPAVCSKCSEIFGAGGQKLQSLIEFENVQRGFSND